MIILTLQAQRPFWRAARSVPDLAASAAASRGTNSMTEPRTENFPSRNWSTGNFSHPTTLPSASRSTAGGNARRAAIPPPISAHYAGAPTTLATLPAHRQLNSFFRPGDLPFHDFSSTIIARYPLTNSTSFKNELFNRIITPYDINAFFIELAIHGLSDRYSILLDYLRNGFPLGDVPILTETIIIPNHSSVSKHPATVQAYIEEESTAGQMAGPFSKSQVEQVLRGPFVASPLIVAESSQGPDQPPKLRVCRNLSKGGKDHLGRKTPSVNSYVQKELFPTTFDSASDVAEFVSLSYFLFLYSIRFLLDQLAAVLSYLLLSQLAAAISLPQ